MILTSASFNYTYRLFDSFIIKIDMYVTDVEY